MTLAISADNMQRDIRRELNKIDDGSAKTVGRRIGQQLESGVSDGAKGAANQVEQRLSAQLGARVGTTVGRAIGTGIQGSITVAAKAGELALKGALVGAAGVAAAAVGGVGLALTKGFDRLKSIDQAKYKLKALGNDAASVSKIMDSALASVKGTAFGMDDAVTAAASAVAAGIKPGQDLTKYLTEVGDAASIAGTSFSDMGSIFNKIQTSNKAYTDDLQQLSDRGIPIFQWLQKEYGVTGEALSKMVQDGKVDAATFQRAIANNIGGAAQKMGQSFEGSVQNLQAALGRLGAAFLAPIFGNAAGGISSITDGLDNLTAWVNAHQPEIITFFTDMGITAVDVAQDIVKSFGNILKGVGEFTTALGSVLDFFGVDNQFSTIGGQIDHIGDALITTAEGFDTAKDKILNWGTAAAQAAEYAQNAVGGAVKGIGTQVGALPFKKVIDISTSGDADTKVRGIGDAVKALPFKKTIELELHGTTTGTAKEAFDGVTLKGPIDNWLSGNGPAPDFKPPNPIRTVPRRATGGPVFGAGSATSDSIPAMLSNGEHVWTADEVAKAGGQGAMYRMRAAVRGFSGGGFAAALPIETEDKRIRRGAGPGTRTRDRRPGNGPGEISIPDWSMPGQGWGGPPDWWWTTPIDPNDVLFPDQWGQRPWGKHPLAKKGIAALSGFAEGGAVGLPDSPGDYVVSPNNVMSALQFAQSVSGNKYSYGAAGPQMFDCSGYMSAIYGIVTGKGMPSGQRYFTTESDFSKLGFLPGYDANSPFNIGVHNGGGGKDSHMAGTLAGYNVESGGSHGDALIGGGAAGALDPQFEKKYHLAGTQLTQAFANSMGDGAQEEVDSIATNKGTSSGGGFDASSLGSSFVGGIMQSIGLDGSVFSNPLEWPNVKSAMALANWGGGLLQGAMGGDGASGADPSGGALTSMGLPSLTGLLTPHGPTSPVDPMTTQHGAGFGAPPGPAVVVNGNVGMDPRGFTDKVAASQNAGWRKNMAAIRP